MYALLSNGIVSHSGSITGTIPCTGTNFADDGNNLNITFPVAATGNSLFFGSNF